MNSRIRTMIIMRESSEVVMKISQIIVSIQIDVQV